MTVHQPKKFDNERRGNNTMRGREICEPALKKVKCRPVNMPPVKRLLSGKGKRFNFMSVEYIWQSRPESLPLGK